MAYVLLYIYLVGLYIRPQDWYGPLKGFPIDSAIIAALVVFMLVRRRQEIIAKTPQTLLFMLWIAALVLSCVSNMLLDYGWNLGINYLKWFLIYLGFILFVDSYEKARNIILFLVFLTVLLAIEGIDHKLSPDGIGWAGQSLGWTDAATQRAGGTGRIQWVGLWDGPNVFCILYIIAAPFLLQFALPPWSKWMRVFAWISLPLLFVAIFFTNSRGGFLALLGAIFFTFWKRFHGPKKYIVTALALVGALAFAPSRMNSMDDEDRSTYHRIEMWYYSIDMLKEQPLLGVGAGQFAEHTGKLIAHNSFIQNMSETGFFGLFIWVALMYASVQSLRRMREMVTDEKMQSLISGLLITFYCYLLMSATLTTEFELIYVLIALSVAFARITQFQMTLARRDLHLISGFVVGGVAAVFLFTRIYLG